MQTHARSLCRWFVVMMWLAGCASPPEEVVATTAALSAGTADFTASPAHDAIARIRNDVNELGCTATFITPNVVVTSRHCIGLADSSEDWIRQFEWRVRTGPCGDNGSPGPSGSTCPMDVADTNDLRSCRVATHPTSDVAVVLLHRIVPSSRVLPAALATSVPPTSATVRRFGFTTLQPSRRYHDASTYDVSQPVFSFSPADYGGFQLGDSGGPTFLFPGSGDPGPIVGVARTGAANHSLVYGPVATWLTARLDPDGNGLLAGQVPPSLLPGQDNDGDGVPNSGAYGILDNCLGVANADQADIDCDTIGDACDADISDRDRDGAADPLDNCWLTFNPDQANCDIDHEILTLAAQRGDGCDASPCPSVRGEVVNSAVAGGGGTTVRFAESSIFEGAPSVGRAFTNTEDSLWAASAWMTTGFRRCPCAALPASATDTPSTRDACNDVCPRTAGEYPSSPRWVQPTVTFTSGLYPGSPNAAGEIVLGYRGYVPLRDESPGRFSLDWDFEADVVETITAMPLGTTRSSTRGLFWAYGVTEVPPPPGESALCTAAATCNVGDPDEHSDYWSGTVTRWVGTALRTSPDIEPWTLSLFPEPICPECLGRIPIPIITGRECFNGSICTADLRVRLPNVELPLSTELGQVLRTELGNATLRWVAAAQTRDALLAGATRVVAIDPAARAVTLAVRATPSTGTPTSLEGVRPGQGGTTLPFTGVSTITGAAYLLDGNRSVVTMIGGTSSGTPATTFRHLDLTTRTQTTISILGTAPGAPLAAALHPFLPFAVVLDRPANGSYRLIRIDTETGLSTVMRTHPHTGTFDAWRLTAMPQGEFLLAASRTDGTGHRVVAFKTAVFAVTERLLSSGSGRLVGSDVFASDRGVTVTARVGTAAWQPVGYAYSTMSAASSGTLSGSF